MYGNQATVAGPPSREVRIPRELEAVAAAIQAVRQVVGELEARLAPVMSMASPEVVANKKESQTGVMMIDTLRAATDDIQGVTSWIASIKGRLEI